jgi:hypothetical protein
MAKKWADMTPDEALAHRQRIDAALSGYEETKADLARRQAEARQRAASTPRVETPLAPESAAAEALPHPVQRSPSAPRDWHAERMWVESIIDAKLAPWPDGIGEALAETRTEIKQHFEARLATMRAELQRDFAEKVEAMRAAFSRALAGDEDALLKRLQKIDDMLDRWSRAETALRDPPYTIEGRAH